MKNSADYNAQVLEAVEKIVKLLQEEFKDDPEVDPMLCLTALITSYIEIGEMHGFEMEFLRESINKSLDNVEHMNAMEQLGKDQLDSTKKEMLN